jgi:hypothetical protein
MGKTTKMFLILGALLVLLMGGRALFYAANPQDDKTLIQKALAESIKASKEGRPGGVMDKLSVNIKYNNENVGSADRDIARYIRSSKPDIELENTIPVVTGDEATIVSPVNLKVALLGQSVSRRLNEVTLVFRKEADRDFLVFPTTRWKLAEVRVPEASVAGLIQ